ncbi:MAG: hypothetical protein ABIJ14_02805 [Nanoarchaeota archaeon]
MNFKESRKTLNKLPEMSPEEQKNFMETDEFREARQTYSIFHPSQRETLYGAGVTSLLDRRTYN